jgi:hypothetical protein
MVAPTCETTVPQPDNNEWLDNYYSGFVNINQ